MFVETSRFGVVEMDESRILVFEDGLLGFPQHKRFGLIQTNDDPVFFWLQSLESPELAFVVCDPLAFVPDYQAQIRAEELAALGMQDVSDSQVLVIVNKVDGYLTGNLLGPLVISAATRKGKQLVLADKRYDTRRRLLKLEKRQPLSMSA